MRSGGFGAGSFAEARARFKAASDDSTTVNLYFIPQHASAMTGLKLVLTSPDGTHQRLSSDDVGTANGWRYYNVRVPLSSPGTWRLEASSGNDRGCFTVTFTP